VTVFAVDRTQLSYMVYVVEMWQGCDKKVQFRVRYILLCSNKLQAV